MYVSVYESHDLRSIFYCPPAPLSVCSCVGGAADFMSPYVDSHVGMHIC